MTPLQNKREMFEKALAQKDFETAQAIIQDTRQLLIKEKRSKTSQEELKEWQSELNAAADKELQV